MFVSSWSPGLRYLVRGLPDILLPLLPVFLVQHSVSAKLRLPSFLWGFAYALAIPTVTVVRSISRRLREDVEIKKLGARRVPVVYSRLPGGMSTVIETVKSFTSGYIGDSVVDLVNEYGPIFNLRILWDDAIFTTEPDHVKALLATEFEKFEKGTRFHGFMESVLGTGVFNSDGDMWKFHRGITRPFFVRDRVTDFELFDRHAEEAIIQLKERFAQGEAVDFQDAMGRFTLDSATQFLFGSCVNSLAAHLPYAHNSPRGSTLPRTHESDTFLAAFSSAQNQVALRSRLSDIWPLAELRKDKTQGSMKTIDDYIRPILNDALAKKNSGEKNSDLGAETLLDHLITQTDDQRILRDEILNIMIAGRDTTMTTLTFIFYCLSQYPSVLARLRNEILTQVGPNRRPTFDDVKECKYMRAVINETLRLYPPVPFNVRHSKHSTTWPAPDGGKPFYIPADVDVPYSVWIMHRRTDLWGPDAQEFDPDRFLDARVQKYLTANPFIFLPFNAGPRICLGQQFAYNETSFMLIRLLQAFDTVSLAPESQPPDSLPPASWKMASGRQAKEKIWPKAHLTTYIYKGLWLRMGEAKYKDEV